MRNSQSLQLPGDSTPAERFGRIARTIPAPGRLALAVTDSANEARLFRGGDIEAMNAVARRAMCASGFGETSHAALDGVTLHAAARVGRARLAGDLLASALRAAVARIRGWHERYRRHLDAQAIYRDLAGLDGRTLADLGIHHRGELRFIAQRLAHGEDPREQRGQR
jgi:hypothetical protein